MSVSRLADDDVRLRPEQGGDVIAYRLEPDGLEFDEPVLLTVTLPLGDGGVPLAVTLSGNRLEVVSGAHFFIDPRNEEIVVRNWLSHFSEWISSDRNRLIDGELIGAGGTHQVGDAFTPRAVSKIARSIRMVLRDDEGNFSFISIIDAAGAWSVKGRFNTYRLSDPNQPYRTVTTEGGMTMLMPNFPSDEPILSPKRIDEAPASATLPETQPEHVEPATFTCIDTGRYDIHYLGEITFHAVHRLIDADGDVTIVDEADATQSWQNFRSGECVAAATPTPTPTETPVPEPTATHTPTPHPLEEFARVLVGDIACAPDPSGDNDMLSDRDWTDIECSAAWIADGTNVSTWFEEGALLECGATGFAGEVSTVVCSEYMLPISDGPVLITRIDLAEPPPRGPNSGATFTYALVVDGDGNTDNNFEHQGSFTLDIFQGTDRWYQIGNDPESGEIFLDTIDARSGGFNQFDTAARAMLFEKSIVFVVSVAEFQAPADRLGVRQTAFSFETGKPIDGTGSMDTAGSDGPAFVNENLFVPQLADSPFSLPGPRRP